MNFVAYAVPFFIASMLFELAYGIYKGRNTYRLNDAVGSLFLGTLSQVRRFVTLGVGGYVYYLITQYMELPLMDTSHWWTWVFAFVLYDFCYYWLHRLGHERMILWAAHVAHHQSEDYNLSTALRQTSTGFLLGWVFYIPMYLAGVPAEVVISVGSLNLLYQYWVHTEHVPKLGWYEWVFVTPSNHRVHHAQNDQYMDRNYGGVFIVCDLLFGTFQEEHASDPPVYGIRGPLRTFNPFRALTHIYVDMIKDSWHTARWQDKLRVWVARTGWRPADVAERYPREKTDLSNFTKYDPAITTWVGIYAIFQLLAVIVLSDRMAAVELSYWWGVALWAVLLTTTVTTAFWLDGGSAVRTLPWEGARLLAIIALLGGSAVGGADPVIWLSGVAYVVANAVLLGVMVWRLNPQRGGAALV